jgi:hypothetical protein
MLTLDDAVQMVTDAEYVVALESPDAEERELQVSRLVDALLERGASSRDEARTLALQAVEQVGGHGDVPHPTGEPDRPGELRLWVPADAFRA